MPSNFEICRDWRFTKTTIDHGEDPGLDDQGWESVHLPHTWNADDMAPGRPQVDMPSSWNNDSEGAGPPAEASYIGEACYRKTFQLPDHQPDDRFFLYFGAVANRSSVWVDGSLVGGKDTGFLAFRMDITNALQDGPDHVIAVKADNSFQWGSVPPVKLDWERYGGIYREVSLIVKGPAYFDFKSIRIAYPQISAQQGMVRVASRIWETGIPNRTVRVEHVLTDPAGQQVSCTSEEFTTVRGRTVASETTLPVVKNPRLWSCETPNLYHLTTRLHEGERLLDEETNPVGFRWMRWDPDEGFFLNDQPVKLRGVNVHQDFPGLGNACPTRFHQRDMELIKEAGLNYIRASHYPRHETVLDLCNRMGILVLEEQPFWHGSIRVYHGPRFLDTVRAQMRDMVNQHGNHPCIIAWNTVNEIMLTPIPGEAHRCPEERDARHRLKPEEWPFAYQCLAAMNDELHRADPSRATMMVIGGSWDKNEEARFTELADIVGYNGGAFHKVIDGKTAYDIGKEKAPERICMMSEGILNDDPRPLRAEWDKEIARTHTLTKHWSRIYTRPWFCGGSMWVFADYSAYGTYRNRAIVDDSRLPYEAYFFFRSLWNPDPMVHICGHWSWKVEPGTPREVQIFTNGEEAELFLNGRSLGIKQPDSSDCPGVEHPPIIWQVPYTPGTLSVKARVQGRILEDSRTTEGAPAQLVLTAENETLCADGQDIAFITAEVQDDKEHRCYNAFGDLHLDVAGAARLAGPTSSKLRGGLARFAIRSTGDADGIQVNGAFGQFTDMATVQPKVRTSTK